VVRAWVVSPPAWAVALVAEYLLENDGFYAKNQERFKRSDTTYFSGWKNGRKKAYPFDGNSSERGLSL